MLQEQKNYKSKSWSIEPQVCSCRNTRSNKKLKLWQLRLLRTHFHWTHLPDYVLLDFFFNVNIPLNHSCVHCVPVIISTTRANQQFKKFKLGNVKLCLLLNFKVIPYQVIKKKSNTLSMWSKKKSNTFYYFSCH